MRILLRILIITVFCLAMVLVYASTTQRGLKLLWQNLQPLLPAGLSIDSVEGRLSGPLTVTGLKFRNDDFSLSLDYAELEWTLPRLLSGVLQLDRLVLEDIRYTPSEQASTVAAEPMAMPERIAMPIALNLEQLRVRNFVFDTASGSQAFIVEQGDASLSYTDVALVIRRLSIHSTGFQIEAGGRLETTGDYPLESILDWRLSPPDYADIEGRTTLSGNLKRLLIAQTFNETYPVSGDFVVTGLPANPSLEATVRADVLSLKAINNDLPDMTLTADIQADGPVDALSLSGRLDINSDQLPPVQASLSAKLSTAKIQLELLQLTIPADQTEVRISGPVELETDATRFDLHAAWSRARWPLTGAAQLESPSGQLHVKGSLDNYLLDSQMMLAAPGYSTAKLALQGNGNQDALQVSGLAIDTLRGHLQGTAAIGWRPRLETSIDIHGNSLDPGVIFAEWPGQLDVQLTSRAEFSSAGIVAEVPRLRLSGQLRDLPLQLETQGDYQKNTLSIEKLALVSGPSSLKFSGSIGASLELDWKLNSPDLHTLLPAASGRLAGEGHVGGTFATPVGRATLSGTDLRYGNDRLSDIELDAAVDITAATESRIELKLGEGLIQGTRINSIDLRADGIPSQHKLKLNADTSLVVGQADALGNWEHNTWHFDLQKARLGHADFAAWTLDRSFHGQLGQDRLAADQSCWHSAGARLCLNGELTAATRNGEVELRDLPLDYFASLLPAGVEAQGTLELDGEIKQKEGRPANTRLRLDSHALALVFPRQGDRPDARIEVSSAKLDLYGGEEKIRFDASILLDNDAKLLMDATISGTDQDFLNRALRGNTSIEIPDIALLGRFTPYVSDTQGSLRGNIQISGSLKAPLLEGKISTADTSLTLDAPGITLAKVEMIVSGQPDGDLMLNLAAQSGDGQLTIKGESNLHSTPRSARFKITGNDFLVMNTLEAKISASPELNLTVASNQLDIDGQIEIPSANIKPRKLPESSVTVSPDQIIVGDDDEMAAGKDYKVSSRVRFIIGEQVKFDGFGLKGRITGNLLAKDQPGKPTTASGELAIHDGKYRAYGQNLDIRTGRLLFAGGPVTEPGLDIEAVRRPSPGILVGVKARGNMRNPEFSLFSEPGMSQSDQLSWLVLGRPLESDASSSQDRNSMNQAAIMLGLGGGLALTEEFGEKVGIDEISIESDPDDETNQASLLVGKYLSPKLFVSYGVGIFEPVSTLRLRYALGSKWKLVGESSALRSGADLFYVIEVGK